MIKVNWCKLDNRAFYPTMNNENEDAGYDFYAMDDITIPIHGSVVINTGIAYKMEFTGNFLTKYVMGKLFKIMILCKSRSGLGIKKSIECTNSGICDMGYKDNIFLKLYNNNDHEYDIKRGDRMAQGIVCLLPKCVIETIDKSELGNSERGKSGLGSSGN